MAVVDLRPLTLGEILDRTFTLYRRNFPLFLGIAAVPAVLQLALNLWNLFYRPSARPGFGVSLAVGLAMIAAYFLSSTWRAGRRTLRRPGRHVPQ